MRRRSRLAFAACAVAAGLTLAACSSGGGTSSSGGSTGGSSASGSNAAFNAGVTKVVNPSTKKGGTLTFALSSTPDSFDPGNTYYAWTFDMTRLWATPLVTYKSCPGACGNTLVPGIATSLGTVSDNGLVWTYHLKPGLKFEDGTPVTSADVKYAVERTYDRAVLANGPTYFPVLLADPKYPGPYKDKTGNLTSITTPDASTIQFHLQSPFPDFNYVASLPQTAPVPPSKDTGSNYQLHPLSTGPYMFQSYQVNKQATLVPNPNWTPNEDPQVSQLASKVIINLNVNAADLDNRLLAGDVDIDAQGIGVQAATRAKILSNPSLEKDADASPGNREWFTYINTKVAPLNNVACRQAIEYAANKTDLQTAWGGPYAGGQVATTLLLPGMGGYSSFDLYNAKTAPTGDLTAAKAALVKCGHPNGFTVGASYRSDRGAETAAVQALQAALARVGIQLQLHGYPSGTYYTDFAGSPNYVHQHNLGVLMGGWSPDWPDGYGMMDELINGNTIAPSGNTNIGELNDPTINGLFAQAANPSITDAQRNAIYGEIDKDAMAQAVILPNVYATNLLYRNPAVTNVYTMTPFGMYNYGVMGVSS
ncbi:MAG TPA: ABC transporter substrate-binding protein [Trebonia sp.]|nr:ABC transporter substrate-binding protein [Trebonia sp.]